MKNCSYCGASNATRAQYCLKCGSPFRVADATPGGSPAATSDSEGSRRVQTVFVDVPSRSANGASGDSARGDAFWSTVGAFLRSAGTVLVDVGRFFKRRVWPAFVYLFRNAPAIFSALATGAKRVWRASRPLRAKAVENAPRYASAVWTRCGAALAPSATWAADYVPNFLVWGVAELFIFRLPFALVGVFYAILANESREEGDFDRARRRAARAKGWLLADLGIGLALAFLRTLGLLGGTALGALF